MKNYRLQVLIDRKFKHMIQSEINRRDEKGEVINVASLIEELIEKGLGKKNGK